MRSYLALGLALVAVACTPASQYNRGINVDYKPSGAAAGQSRLVGSALKYADKDLETIKATGAVYLGELEAQRRHVAIAVGVHERALGVALAEQGDVVDDRIDEAVDDEREVFAERLGQLEIKGVDALGVELRGRELGVTAVAEGELVEARRAVRRSEHGLQRRAVGVLPDDREPRRYRALEAGLVDRRVRGRLARRRILAEGPPVEAQAGVQGEPLGEAPLEQGVGGERQTVVVLVEQQLAVADVSILEAIVVAVLREQARGQHEVLAEGAAHAPLEEQ